MSYRALVSTPPLRGCPPALSAAPGSTIQASLAHDLRNLLATVGLHVETLQRLSGPDGVKAADAAHALLLRGVTLCNSARERVALGGPHALRRGIDLLQIVREVAGLLRPCAPKGFSFNIARDGTGSVFADPDDVFRILFNLMNNAVAVANSRPGTLMTIAIEVSTEDANVTIRVSDDGPGLPVGARKRLFVRESRGMKPSCQVHGLVIAGELAERNGGALALIPSAKGASFALTLPAALSFGPRAMSL